MAPVPTMFQRTGPHHLWLKDAVELAVSLHQLSNITHLHSLTLPGSVLKAENTKRGHCVAPAPKACNIVKGTGSQPLWVKGPLEK